MSTNSIHHRFTLQAIERLKLRKKIETLFQTGEAFSVYPLRIVYLPVKRETDEISPIRIGFSIPKKRIKKATGRNRIKRLFKEAWRMQKQNCYPSVPANLQLHCFFIFTGKEKFTFADAVSAVAKAIDKLNGIMGKWPPQEATAL